MPSIAEFNAEKSHLSDAESQKLIDLVIHQANRGFPLTNHLIEDYANLILQARNEPGYGLNFRGVGINCCSSWLRKWKAHVSSYWSTLLETLWANALTPENTKHWFDLYCDTVQIEEITLEWSFQMDEVGTMLGAGRKVKVVGNAGARTQHTQHSNNCKLVTMLPTISGDGKHLKPTAIFKGKNLLQCWVDENPLQCS